MDTSPDNDSEVRPIIAKSHERFRSTSNASTPRLARYATTAMAACMFLNFTAFYLPTAFYPQEVEQKKGSAADTEVGVVIGSTYVAAFIASILFGKYMDSIGAKFLIVSGAFLVGGSTLIFGFVSNTSNWIVFIALSSAIRFVMGVGEGAFDTTSIAVGLTMFPARTATVWSVFEVAAGLGTIAGPPLGGFLYDTHGFLIPFVVVGSIITTSVIFLFGLVPSVTRLSDQSVISVWPILKMLPTVMACLGVFWSYGAFSLLTATMPLFLHKTLHWSPTKISTTFLTNSVAYGLSALLCGWLADATNPRALLIAGLLSEACGLLLIGPSFVFESLTTKPWLIYVGIATMGLGGAAIQVSAGLDIIRGAVARGYQEDLSLNGCVSGLVMASSFLSQAVGSPIGGALTAKFSFRYSTSFVAFVILAQGAVSVIMTIL